MERLNFRYENLTIQESEQSFTALEDESPEETAISSESDQAAQMLAIINSMPEYKDMGLFPESELKDDRTLINQTRENIGHDLETVERNYLPGESNFFQYLERKNGELIKK